MQKTPLAILVCGLAALAAQPVPPGLFDQLQWRFIGPFRGGRVVAVTGIPGDPTTFYFGSVGGGVWKTTNAGVTWIPIFDGQPVASIGAIAVAPSDPQILYVGTGETDIRSQNGFGDGVYKSTDAGKTWRNVGLRDTRQIGDILVDPKDPNHVYVAALGHTYAPNEERGVFQSTDGGQNWRKVLFTSPETGAVDLAWDPANPRNMFAVLWNGRRPVWSQYPAIEGPGSGLWKSTDAGEHWSQVTGNGLPTGMWRRSGVAVAAGGRRVYALIDAPAGAGLYRSDDGGINWTHTTTDSRITSRGWYFGAITVDPKNPDLVYVPNVALYRSTDGGISFTVLKGAPGGDDYHALWVDPSGTHRMIQGSDQGVSISVDAGSTWSTWYNQPTAQMYHVITDNRFPYAVYGSQQDSGTAAVMSRTDHGEIDARDWFPVGGAESGYIAIDPKNNNIFYVGNTGGSLARFDKGTAQSQNVTPWPIRNGGFAGGISIQKYRFPWTAPLVFSAADPTALYYGAQYLLKTVDGGLTWKEISPDLTGDTRKEKKAPDVPVTIDNAKELGFGVIYAIGPSPLKSALIWVGSDTGLIHVTQDGGTTWQNVTPKGLAAWGRVTQIEASHFDPAEAYASVDSHRKDDYQPYAYRTRDYGKTWTRITDGLAAPAYLNGIREDPKRKGLLYATTELGVAVSFDDGDHWQALQLNLPAVSVRDLVVHGDDLVIATHGRGFWILDDATPLRQMDSPAVTADAFLFKPAPAIRMNPEDFMGTPFPLEEPKAPNPPDGAIIDYYFKSPPEGEVTLEVLDAKGQLIRSYSSKPAQQQPRRPGAIADAWIQDQPPLTTRAGMNRFVWDLRYASPGTETPDESDFLRPTPGPQVLPGVYTVRLKAGAKTLSQPLTVKLDPRSTATPLELTKQFDLSLSCWKAIKRSLELTHEVRAFERALADRRSGANVAAGNKISELQHDAEQIAGSRRDDIAAQLSIAMAVAGSADRTPPATAYLIYEQASKDLTARQAEWKRLKEVDIPALNSLLTSNKQPPI